MPREDNEPLITKLVWAHMVLGRIAEAKAALKDLLKYGPSEEAMHLQEKLGSNYPRVSPVKSGGFRLGFIAIVIAVLAIYGFAGYAIFSGPPETSTTIESPPSQPAPTTVPQPTPVTPSPRVPLIPPDNSFVKWQDSSGWTVETAVTISGSVTNTHNDWSITDVRIEMEMVDKYGKVIQQATVAVSPSTIPPGRKGEYYQVVKVTSACESGNTAIYWVWSPP